MIATVRTRSGARFCHPRSKRASILAAMALLCAGTVAAEQEAARLELWCSSATGYWPMEMDAGGRLRDLSGHGRHGTVVGARLTTDTPGGSGHALRFDGDSAYVMLSPDQPLIPREGDWTVMGWLNVHGDGEAATFLQAGLGGEQGNRALFYHREGELRLWSGSAGLVVAAPGIAGTGWRHVAYRREGDTFELYVDGEPVATADAPRLVIGAGLKLGARPGSRRMALDGMIDEVVIHDRALPPQAIRRFYASPGESATLVLQQGKFDAAVGNRVAVTVRVVDAEGRPVTRGTYANLIATDTGTLNPPNVTIVEGEATARFTWIHDEPGAYRLTADHAGLGGAALEVALAPTPPTITVISPSHRVGLLEPDGAFAFQLTSHAPVDASHITVQLNGEDVTHRLEITGTPRDRRVRLADLEPDTTYHAVITARNAWATAEHATRFMTFRDRVDGYRGIWWSHGPVRDRPGVRSYDSQDFKYSGPLSFAWGHTLTPMAVYAPEVEKTFFVYGGDTGPEDRYLMIMAAYYDHANHRVPRPTIVRDQRGVDDPHDNPSLLIDADGHLWVFIAGRGRRRPGQIFRGTEPYSIDTFEKVISREQTYSQVWHVPGEGIFHLLTLYTAGRELYWETSRDGTDWTDQPAEDLPKLAGFGGHYQVSRVHGRTVGTAFNYHPDGNVDRRTNLYYLETEDFGETWTTADGTVVQTPLDRRDNPALITDYEAQGQIVYPSKLLFDRHGHPVILYITSFGAAPVPENDPRVWKTARWTGSEWVRRAITVSDHNYDMGSLYIDGDRWTLIAPALTGPQPYFTGGEVGVWSTTDPDREWWPLERRVTHRSPFNHCYLRRPHNPVDPFFAVWADSDSSRSSISRLYFTDSTGERLYKLPYTMDGDYAEPVLLDPPVPPDPRQTRSR